MNAHATSTPLGDAAETKVIKIAFGEEHAKTKLAVSSTKGATGSLLRRGRRGRGGVHDARGRRPQGAADDQLRPSPIPDCDLDYVPNEARDLPDLRVAVSNSFGFGGHNASIVIRAFEE